MKLILNVQGRYSTKIKMQLVINDKTISFNKYKMNFLGYVSEAWQPQQRNTKQCGSLFREYGHWLVTQQSPVLYYFFNNSLATQKQISAEPCRCERNAIMLARKKLINF